MPSFVLFLHPNNFSFSFVPGGTQFSKFANNSNSQQGQKQTTPTLMLPNNNSQKRRKKYKTNYVQVSWSGAVSVNLYDVCAMWDRSELCWIGVADIIDFHIFSSLSIECLFV